MDSAQPKSKGRGRGRGGPKKPEPTPTPGAAGQSSSSGSSSGVVSAPSIPPTPSTTAEFTEELEPLPVLPPRPDDGGHVGRPIQVVSNFLRVQLQGTKTIHLYTFVVAKGGKPATQREKMELLHLILSSKEVRCPNPTMMAFDSAALLFSLERLTDSVVGGKVSMEHSGRVADNDMRWTYSLKLTYRGAFELGSDVEWCSPLINQGGVRVFPAEVLDAVINQWASDTRFLKGAWVNTGVSSFMNPYHESLQGGRPDGSLMPIDVGLFKEAWRGIFAKSRIGLSQGQRLPFVNIDISSCIFFKAPPDGDMLDVLIEIFSQKSGRHVSRSQLNASSTINLSDLKYVQDEFKGLKVKALHLEEPRVYSIKRLYQEGASTYEFSRKDRKTGVEQTVTVQQHIQSTYGINLRFPCLPLMDLGGNKERPIMMPLELCRLYSPQRSTRKLPEDAASKMIKELCKPAPKRKEAIERTAMQSPLLKNPWLESFGVEIEQRMHEVTGRLLQAPQIEYHGHKMVEAQNGSWMPDRARAQFLEPQDLINYGLVALRGPRGQGKAELEQFCEVLQSVARKQGIRLTEFPGLVYFDLSSDKDLSENISKIVQDMPNCRLIIIVMPARNAAHYMGVKRLGDIGLGIATQCVLWKNVAPAKPNTIYNILLKINTKLGGKCHRIALNLDHPSNPVEHLFAGGDTIVLGMDVTHPTFRESRVPSMAAVVGSVEPNPVVFGASVKVQKRRQELITYLGHAVAERLIAFFESTGRRPNNLLIFRDGVADSMFNQVVGEEYNAIRKGCERLDANYQPKITLIVVQKRHHVRFFPVNPNEGVGKAQNVHPGTVVDTDVAHPAQFDFWLCSHFGIQGTSRPAYYTVLKNEIGLSSDDVQMVSYYLCHVYARCPRSVSIPAPVYYADLVCERARLMINELYARPSTTSPTTPPTKKSSDSGEAKAEKKGSGSGSGKSPEELDDEYPEQKVSACVQVHDNFVKGNIMYFM